MDTPSAVKNLFASGLTALAVCLIGPLTGSQSMANVVAGIIAHAAARGPEVAWIEGRNLVFAGRHWSLRQRGYKGIRLQTL